jgi:hypothetical protein
MKFIALLLEEFIGKFGLGLVGGRSGRLGRCLNGLRESAWACWRLLGFLCLLGLIEILWFFNLLGWF